MRKPGGARRCVIDASRRASSPRARVSRAHNNIALGSDSTASFWLTRVHTHAQPLNRSTLVWHDNYRHKYSDKTTDTGTGTVVTISTTSITSLIVHAKGYFDRSSFEIDARAGFEGIGGRGGTGNSARVDISFVGEPPSAALAPAAIRSLASVLRTIEIMLWRDAPLPLAGLNSFALSEISVLLRGPRGAAREGMVFERLRPPVMPGRREVGEVSLGVR